ncbi:hypothetical protein ANTRET_LOCUS431 [Anthophora retusa]
MEDFIPTRVSRLRQDGANEFVSVIYEGRKKKKAEVAENTKESEARSSKFGIKAPERNEDIDERKKQELEMKRIRYEVMKFGMSGLGTAKAKKNAEAALAMSLGAKRPKRKGMNYKELKYQRKRCKEGQQDKMKLTSGLEKSLMKRKAKKPRKKASDGILEVYGKVNKKSLGKNIK